MRTNHCHRWFLNRYCASDCVRSYGCVVLRLESTLACRPCLGGVVGVRVGGRSGGVSPGRWADPAPRPGSRFHFICRRVVLGLPLSLSSTLPSSRRSTSALLDATHFPFLSSAADASAKHLTIPVSVPGKFRKYANFARSIIGASPFSRLVIYRGRACEVLRSRGSVGMMLPYELLLERIARVEK